MDVWSFKDQDAFWNDTIELSGNDIKTRFNVKLLRLALKAYWKMKKSKPKLVIIKKVWKWKFKNVDDETSSIINKKDQEDISRLRRPILLHNREELTFSLRRSNLNNRLHKNSSISGPSTPNIHWNKLFLKHSQNYMSRNKNTLACSTVNPGNSSLSVNINMKLSLHSRKASLTGTTQEPNLSPGTYNSQLPIAIPRIRRSQNSKILVLKKSMQERYSCCFVLPQLTLNV